MIPNPDLCESANPLHNSNTPSLHLLPMPSTTWTPMEIPPDINRHGIYVGTSGYYFDDWIGRFNPPKSFRARTPEESDWNDRLCFYQRYFSFVEINTTFYREPALTHFVDIERRSKESMKYAVKASRDISHTREWNTARGRELMQQHVTAVSPLIETGRFFSFLIQLEDHVYRSQKRLDYLLSTAEAAVRSRVGVHIEFRHISWHTQFVLQSLKDAGVGICNTDIPAVPHAFPLKAYATTDKGYIRYSGKNLANWYQETSAPEGPSSAGTDSRSPSHSLPARQSERDRLASRNARYDYQYTEQEVDHHVSDQLKLSKKTSASAIAYNNHYQTQAVKNAVENMKKLQAVLEAGV